MKMPLSKALAIMESVRYNRRHWMGLEKRWSTDEEEKEAAQVKREYVKSIISAGGLKTRLGGSQGA